MKKCKLVEAAAGLAVATGRSCEGRRRFIKQYYASMSPQGKVCVQDIRLNRRIIECSASNSSSTTNHKSISEYT